jgi:glycosyltransferase involved in cell wall biosynthesis
MAERIDAMAADRSIAESMTEACLARAAKVTWGKVAETLLEACERSIDRRGAAARGGRSARAGRRPIELLVTDNQLLDPPVGGGRLRILELYRHLPEDFGTTYLGAFDHPGPAFRDRALAPNFREIVVPLTAGHFKLHHALARLSRGAATVDVTMPTLGRMSPRYRRELERLLPGADILIGAHPWMLPQFPRDVSTPIVYDAQNCEARVKAPMLEGSLTGRWLTGRVRAAERLAIERSRLILACSEEDRDAFIEEYGAAPEKIAVVPNGVDCAAIRPVDEARRSELKSERGLGDGPVALFAGSNYEPNLEAAEFIVDRLAPALPAVRFAIVGGVGVMLKERRRDWMPPENARLFGFVDFATLRELYGAADVALNPMSHGSGTNIKMFDYMAAALPILTTAVGARGLRGRGAEPWIEAPLDRWSEELAGLVANAETQRKLGEGARSLAEEKYDWSKISGELAERLRELVRR